MQELALNLTFCMERWMRTDWWKQGTVWFWTNCSSCCHFKLTCSSPSLNAAQQACDSCCHFLPHRELFVFTLVKSNQICVQVLWFLSASFSFLTIPVCPPCGHIAMLDCTPVLTDTSIKCMFVSHMVIFGVSVSVLHTLNLIFYIKVCAEMFAQLAV